MRAPGVSGRGKARLGGLLVAGASLSLLITGAMLDPEPAGHGTHAQLGLPGCGFLSATGHPCPTCGMTTAVALAADLRLGESFLTQPFGFLVALGAAVAFWAGVHVAATGSDLARVFGILLRPRSVWAASAMLGGSWAYVWWSWGR